VGDESAQPNSVGHFKGGGRKKSHWGVFKYCCEENRNARKKKKTKTKSKKKRVKSLLARKVTIQSGTKVQNSKHTGGGTWCNGKRTKAETSLKRELASFEKEESKGE